MQHKLIAAALASFAIGSAMAGPIDVGALQVRGEQAKQAAQCGGDCGTPYSDRLYHGYWDNGRYIEPSSAEYNFKYANKENYYNKESTGSASGSSSQGGGIEARGEQAKQAAQCGGDCGTPYSDRLYHGYWDNGRYIEPSSAEYNFKYANKENYYNKESTGSASASSHQGGGIEARGEQAKQAKQVGQAVANRQYYPYWYNGQYIRPSDAEYNFNYANSEQYYNKENSASGSAYSHTGGSEDGVW